MTTQRQADANRANAAKSTGPKTDEGKEASRANAMTHGMTAKVVMPEEMQAKFLERLEAWTVDLAPVGAVQNYHAEQAVLASLRVENCQANEVTRKVILSRLAADPGPKWDQARKDEASRLGKSLRRNPECVMNGLRQTPAGRAWLIAQWVHLLGAVPVEGVRGWSETESQVALDLLGRPRTLRSSAETLAPFANLAEVRSLIEAQIEALTAEDADAEAENAELRQLHHHGMGLENDTTLKLMRRYESAANRQLEKSTKIIKQSQAAATKPTVCETKPIPQAKPADPGPVAAPNPDPTPAYEVRGNRKFRRQQQVRSRKQAAHAR